jgi:hypothetical protein
MADTSKARYPYFGMSEHSQTVRNRNTRPGTAAGAALVAILLVTSVPASAVGEVRRAEYVVRLEKICKPDSEATRRAVRGTRSDVRSERFRRAAAKVAKAQRIFAGTVRAISRVPRPVADRATLARWFAALKREAGALGRTAASLRNEDVARFQRVWADFIHEANKANNVVISFGFNHCAFKPSRFQ